MDIMSESYMIKVSDIMNEGTDVLCGGEVALGIHVLA